MRNISIFVLLISIASGLTLLNNGSTYTSITPDSSDYYDVFDHHGDDDALLLKGSRLGTTVIYELEGWLTLGEIASMRIGFEGYETGSGDGPTVLLVREGDVSTLEGGFTDTDEMGWHELEISEPGLFENSEGYFMVKFGFVNMPMDTTEIWQVSVNLEFYDEDCASSPTENLVFFYNPTTFFSVIPQDSIVIIDSMSVGWELSCDSDMLDFYPATGSGNATVHIDINHDALESLDNGVYTTNFILTSASCPADTINTSVKVGRRCPFIAKDGPLTFMFDAVTGVLAPPQHMLHVVDQGLAGWSLEIIDAGYFTLEPDAGSGSESVSLRPDSAAIATLLPGTHSTRVVILPSGGFCEPETVVVTVRIPAVDEISPYLRTFAGKSHVIMIDPLGIVYTSGLNSRGMLGLMDTTDRLSPTPVPGLQGIKAAAGGVDHTLVMSAEGQVWAWGDNSFGQLAETTAEVPLRTGVADSITMELDVDPVPTIPPARAIGAGNGFSVALAGDGIAWTWGNNLSGQLGTGDFDCRSTPMPISDVNFTNIAVGFDHVIALYESDEGIVKTWGMNTSGQIGDGTTTDRPEPYHIPDLFDVTSIAAGNGHTVVVTADGIVYAWGENSNGELGLMDTTDRLSPTPVPGLISERANIRAVSAGRKHILALDQNGRLWAWGDNTFGQLGIGLFGSYSDRPRRVRTGDGGYLENIIAVDAGGGFSLALDSEGNLFGWGRNDSGQLASGSHSSSASPATSISPVWAVTEPKSSLPQKIFLPTAYPNPFNGAVEIKVPTNSTIQIYDIEGRLIHSRIADSEKYIWRPEDIGSGVYLLRVNTWGIESVLPVVYVK